MREITHLSKEEEEIADDIGLWKPIDILVMSKILWMTNERTFLTIENIRQSLEKQQISRKDIADSISHLRRRGLLSTTEQLSYDLTKIQVVHIVEKEMIVIVQLPENWRELPEEEFNEIMYRRAEKARERIIRWKEVRRAPKEVEKTKQEIEGIKEELKKSESEMLRNMVAIFALFVSIFSFILIGAGGAVSIQPKTFDEFCALILVIFLPILSLLLVTYFLFIGKKSLAEILDEIQRIVGFEE